MKALLIAGVAVMSATGTAFVFAEQPDVKAEDARSAQSVPLFMTERRSTPDTSTPGSTAPGNPASMRPAYVSQQAQYYAAELRRCESMGEAAQRRACKNSVRNKFGEM